MSLIDIADLTSGGEASPKAVDVRSIRIERTLARLRSARVHLLDVKMMIGSGYDEPKPYEVRDGVAVVEISGPLMADSWWYQDYCSVLEAVKMAGDDSQVQGILLRINSPGGETDRAFETAAEIETIGEKKPIWCVADVSAYSAGYLLACCAEKIYAAPISGGVGSIGVYCAHWDYSEYLKQVGIKVTLIGDPDGKTSGNPYEPLDEDTEKELRAEIERLSGEFFAFVARRRKMTVEEVRGLNAGLFHGGARAVSSKLADQSGTLETALSDMVTAMRERPIYSVAASAAATIPKEVRMDIEKTEAGTVLKPAEQNPAAVAEPPKVEAKPATPKVTEMPQPAAADLETVLALCAVAGKSATEAVELHKQGMTIEKLRVHLVESRVAADEKQPTVSIGGLPGKGSSMTAIAAKAEQIRAEQPALSKEQSIARVMRANPDLYAQYLAENPAQTSKL